MIVFEEVRLLELYEKKEGEEEIGEEEVRSCLADFSCPQNSDIEKFLHDQAILFAKKGIAQTFLVYAIISEEAVEELVTEATLVGYYALANKHIIISQKGLNRRWRDRIEMFAEYDEGVSGYPVTLPLIGQLGKNFHNGANNLISGVELLNMACNRVKKALKILGGKTAYLECEDNPKLISFYEKNGFFPFSERESNKDESEDKRCFIQLIRYFSHKD